jgi:hypothetical protein
MRRGPVGLTGASTYWCDARRLQRPQQSERGISDDARAGRGHQGDRSAARAVISLTLAFSSDPVMRWGWPRAERYLTSGAADRRRVRWDSRRSRHRAHPGRTVWPSRCGCPLASDPTRRPSSGYQHERYGADRRRQAPLPDGSPCRGDGRNSAIDRRCVVDAVHQAALRRDHARDGRGACRLDGADGDPAFRVKGGATTTSCPSVRDDDRPASREP